MIYFDPIYPVLLLILLLIPAHHPLLCLYQPPALSLPRNISINHSINHALAPRLYPSQFEALLLILEPLELYVLDLAETLKEESLANAIVGRPF